MFGDLSVPEAGQSASSNNQRPALSAADTLNETLPVLVPFPDGSLATIMDFSPLQSVDSTGINLPTDSAEVSELTTPGTIETLAAILPSKAPSPDSENDKMPDSILDYEDKSYADLPLPLSPSLDTDGDGVSDAFEVIIYRTDPHDPNSLL